MRVYAFKSFEYHTSSSGGAFPALARAYYEDVGDELIVFGAAFTDDYSVEHYGKKYKDGIECFQESKYVRSSIQDSLIEIPKLIKDGIPVMFVGTPCQVAAIQTKLKKEGRGDTDLLLTIDLICHGTPKAELWLDYVKLIEKVHGRIKRVCFRNNEFRGKGQTFIILENNRIVYDPLELKTYMRLFSTDLSLCKGCFNCRFRNKDLYRPADLTIGDFWGAQDIVPEFKRVENVSLVIPNTEKGKRIFEIIKETSTDSTLIRECEDDRWRVFNPHLFEQTPVPKTYDVFWEDYKTLTFEEFNKKYIKDGLKFRIKLKISNLLGRIGLKYKVKTIVAKYKGQRL